MQQVPDPLAHLLDQLTDLGVAVVMQGRRQDAVHLGRSQRPAPALMLSVVVAVTPPASPTAVPSPANDNAEG